ncbi:MAG: DNA-binding winged helix-turn-helix (wHTH) protein/Flp pilus assembly protein TadD [Phenylobacterium sp.]|jgi:DNA-binding winged helix-turn-helix (wHTH) protein/Flp pilus assembly protein TadD
MPHSTLQENRLPAATNARSTAHTAHWCLYQINDLSLNTQLGTLHRGDQEIALPPLSYKMLCQLVQRAPAIVSQDELMTLVWGDLVVSDETLKQRIKLLRQAISDTPQKPQYIASVRGRGYRCIANIDKQELTPPTPSIPYSARHHDSINLRLNDRLPVSFMQSSADYWRLASLFFLVVFTVLVTVFIINIFSLPGQPKPQPNTTTQNRPTANSTPNSIPKDSISVQAKNAYAKGRTFYLRYQPMDNEMAIKSYLQATELAPDYAIAFAGLADAYSQGVFQFSAGESWQKKALEAAYDAIMLDDQMAQSYKALGTAHYVNGHLSQALSANLKAIEITPDYVEAQANLGYIYSERGQLNNALERHYSVYQTDPSYQVNWYHIALTLQRLGLYQQAAPWYKKVLKARAHYHLATFHYSRLLISQGHIDQAESLLKQAEKRSPDSLNVLKGLAELYLLNQQVEQAKPWIHKLKLFSNGENRQYAELLTLLSQQDPQQLNQWYNKHANDYNERPFNNVQLAIAASALGQTDTAFRHLIQAIELGWLDSDYLRLFVFLKPLQQHHKFQRILQLQQRKRQNETTRVKNQLILKLEAIITTH